MDEDARKKTQATAAKLFGKGIKMDPPYLMWKEFDRDLANDFSLFITGNLYFESYVMPLVREISSALIVLETGLPQLTEVYVNDWVTGVDLS